MEQRGIKIPMDNRISSLRLELGQAIHFNKKSLFRKIIDDLDDLASCCSALESYDSDTQTSPFEMACEQNGRAHFIRECVSIGCDANKKNPKCGRRPVSFAIEHFSYDNLEALLADTSVCLDFEHSHDFPFTPINYLLEQVSDESFAFKETCLCVESLVKHCADVNAPGKLGKTPIRTILEKKSLNDMRKTTLAQCIFDHAKDIDIDDDNGTVRRRLHELIPNLRLPPVRGQVDQGLNVDSIERSLKDFDGNESEFWQYFRLNKYKSPESYWHSALDYAVRKGLIYSVEKIFRCGFISTIHSLDECKEPLLTSAIRQIGRNDNANTEKCLNLFLNNRKVHINATDTFGYAALFSSVKFVKSNVTPKLLERGAYLGMESKWGDLAIADMKPQLLEKHFDSCITTDTENINKESLALAFDYKNLIPLRGKLVCSERSTEFREMKAIECILETHTLRHLIKHPLVESFLDLKWNRLAIIFYANFFFCTLFAVLNTFYILAFFLDDIVSTVPITVCQMMCLCQMIARETIQMISSPRIYFRRWQNYLECTLIGLVIYIQFGTCPMVWRGTVSAAAILLIAYEFSVLIGSLPIRSFAMHYVMLETVTTNFIKSLLFYSILIVAFALTFYSLFHKLLSSETSSERTSNRTDDGKSEDPYNSFQSVGLSMLKSIVMANGELDAGSIDFNDNALTYIAFVAFILLVTTVLGNLLSGLAVSDINEIRAQAQWTHLIRRCEVLVLYEKSLLDPSSFLIWFPKLKQFIRSAICLYPDFKWEYQMKFRPNKRRERKIRQLVENWFWRMFCRNSHCQIDDDIIREALKRVNKNKADESDLEVLSNQISKIVDSNNSMQNQIDSIEKTMKSIERMIELKNKI